MLLPSYKVLILKSDRYRSPVSGQILGIGQGYYIICNLVEGALIVGNHRNVTHKGIY